MKIAVKLLYLILIVKTEVDAKSVDSITPITLAEKVKFRQNRNKLETRFSDETIIENEPIPQKPSLNEDSGLLEFTSVDSRFVFEDDIKVEQRKLEYGDLFEGDIELMPEQEVLKTQETNNDDETVFSRTGKLSEYYRWPKNRQGYVIVPYHIYTKSGYSPSQMSAIKSGMKHIEKYTCIRFIPWGKQDDFILIHSGRGCNSNVGRIGGQQDISLQKNGCLSQGTIVHELIHALGFTHMQNHAERDKYVDIIWDNIQTKHRHNFEKVDRRYHSNYDTKYDYFSVMHYEQDAFARDDRYATLVPKVRKYQATIGQRNGMSNGDAIRLNNMYSCYE